MQTTLWCSYFDGKQLLPKGKLIFLAFYFLKIFPVIMFSWEEVKNFLQFFTFCLMFFFLFKFVIGA